MRWALAAALLVLSACEDTGSSRSNFYCVYEERRTSCSSSSYGPWEEHCVFVGEEIREDLTPDTYCDFVYPPSDTHCAGSCCLSFQFRNVTSSSSCP